ncbi:MAG: hypothetical protein LBM56_00265 [Burkholderiaceae bacterium]|jgi:hypothetical protein|nr:hypothetical protein [Burkholderiaceae bacterium]
MILFLCAIPVLLLIGLIGLFIYCKQTDDARLKEAGHAYYNHPDKDMPLYNKGHCDRYSVGTFYW